MAGPGRQGGRVKRHFCQCTFDQWYQIRTQCTQLSPFNVDYSAFPAIHEREPDNRRVAITLRFYIPLTGKLRRPKTRRDGARSSNNRGKNETQFHLEMFQLLISPIQVRIISMWNIRFIGLRYKCLRTFNIRLFSSTVYFIFLSRTITWVGHTESEYARGDYLDLYNRPDDYDWSHLFCLKDVATCYH